MSYTYLQEQGEESLAESFQDIPVYVLSRLNLTQDKCCFKDSETESCHGSQSGMISTLLMENLGEEKLTLSPEDFLAKTFPQLEKELESRANEADSGVKWRGWLAKYDQDLSLWKTPQCSLLEDYIEFSETWPNWGIMHDGAFWELTTQVRHIGERESGYWHTPTLAPDAPNANANRKCGPNSLTDCAKIGSPLYKNRMIPTPTCADAFTSNLKSTQQKPDTMHSVSLAQLCEKMPEKMWPTPQSRDWKDSMSEAAPSIGKTRGFSLGQKIGDIESKNKEMWPTPTVAEATKIGARANYGQIGLNNHPRIRGLPNREKLQKDRAGYDGSKPPRQNYPTPRAVDYKDSYNCDRGEGSMDDGHLPIVIFREHKSSFPTPGTTGMSNGTGNCEKANKLHEAGQISEEERRSMRAGNGGQLNPDWVEWLMGWPIGWTKTEPIELDWRDWVVDPADIDEVPRVLQSIQNRVHRLKAIGNGQVPLVAATAWKILSDGLQRE